MGKLRLYRFERLGVVILTQRRAGNFDVPSVVNEAIPRPPAR